MSAARTIRRIARTAMLGATAVIVVMTAGSVLGGWVGPRDPGIAVPSAPIVVAERTEAVPPSALPPVPAAIPTAPTAAGASPAGASQPERGTIGLPRLPSAPRPRVSVAALPGDASQEFTPPQLPDLSRFTVQAVRDMVPRTFDGRTAQLEPLVSTMYMRPSSREELARLWTGERNPLAIVLDHGAYTLEMIVDQIARPDIIARDGERTFLLRRPLFVGHNATLVIQGGEWLRMDVDGGAILGSLGTVIVVDSRISSWDRQRQDWGPRPELTHANYLLYDEQRPRPYLVFNSGSRTYIAASVLHGLGYKGLGSTFGLSFSSGPRGSGPFRQIVDNLARPTGWLIANRIEELFFGVYTYETDDLVVVGNEFVRNVVYGVDPHDYSRRLIIARNIARHSRFAHGIIISREVNDSWIFENIAYGNHGSGIMLDRRSEHNVVANNLVYENDGDGIAIFESENNLVYNNRIARNRRNGIYVRNSWNVDVIGNAIELNGNNGIELAAVDISSLETRNFQLDPYQQRAGARLLDNEFTDNFNAAIHARSIERLEIDRNRYVRQGPRFFGGDLVPVAGPLSRVLIHERGRVLVRGSAPAASPAAPGAVAADEGRSVR